MPVYPAKLPESIRNNPKQAAELKLYDYFQENLPDNYSAIYIIFADDKTAQCLKQIGLELDW